MTGDSPQLPQYLYEPARTLLVAAALSALFCFGKDYVWVPAKTTVMGPPTAWALTLPNAQLREAVPGGCSEECRRSRRIGDLLKRVNLPEAGFQDMAVTLREPNFRRDPYDTVTAQT
jgi:hypothetical protein